MFGKSTFNKIFTVLILFSCLLAEVTPFSSKGSPSDGKVGSFSDALKTPVLITGVCSVAFLSVFILIIFKCADCYNSEVSSENHPACGDSKEYKWGGAEGYTSVNSSNPNAGFRTGEVVEMTPQHSLPYAIIPTQAPAVSGFQGFSTHGQGDEYSSSGFDYHGSVHSNSSHGTPRHYNPIETDEPPPTYETAARQGSLHGHR